MEANYTPLTTSECLTVTIVGRIDVINWDNLVRIEASSNYSRLFLANGKTLFVAKVLKKFEKELDNRIFIRSHKTHLVNCSFIKSYIKGANSSLLLSTGDCIPVARNKKRQMRLLQTG